MITKKVPLTVFDKDGKRTVIGEAVVDIEGDTFGVVARVTDDRVIKTLTDIRMLSFGPVNGRQETPDGDPS